MVTGKGIEPRKGGQLRLLDDAKLRALHSATVEILGEVGIRVQHPKALRLLEAAGCKVDSGSMVARFPEQVLMDLVAKAPREVTLYGRDSRHDVALGPNGDVYVMGGAGALHVLDLEGKRRPSTLQDLRDLTRLEDTLENMDIAHFLVTPQDIPQVGFEMITFAEMLKNNTRNFYALLGGCREGLEYELEMASVVAGSSALRRPFFTAGLCLVSPLTQTRDFIEELFACAEHGVPAYVESDALSGGTAPITIAGTLVEVNANVLSAVALAQIRRSGSPCIYSSSSGVFDMRSMNLAGSAPESTLLHMAQAQLAHFYGLPYYGSNTPDSKLPDAQMGYERALHFLGCAQAGVNIIHVAIGNLEMMRLASFEQCLIDNEILGAAFRMLDGFDCSREAIGVDAFREVGHAGHFLDSAHTLRYLRSERWVPTLTDRGTWEKWYGETGGADMRQRAREKAAQILAEPAPRYVDERQAREIDRIAAHAQAELGSRVG